LHHWADIAALALGGAFGVNARHFAGRWVTHWAGHAFPWGTFVINVSGAFVIGFLAMTLDRWFPSPRVRLMVVTGFLGGYTTFSSYALETLLLWESGSPVRASVYLLGSALVGLLAVVLGLALAKFLVFRNLV
jgi:CrcB protein